MSSLLFVAGVAMVWVQVLVALQMDVSLAPMGGEIRMAFQLVYPFAIALSGVGAVLAERWKVSPTRSLRWAGAGILAMLVVCLRVHLAVPLELLEQAVPRALTYMVGLGFPLLALSTGVAAAFFESHARGTLFKAVAIHLLGLLVGYLLVAPLLHGVGANAALAVVGLGLLLGGSRGAVIIPVLLMGAVSLDLDRRIERFRFIETMWADKMASGEDDDSSPRLLAKVLESEPIHLDWGLYHQFRVARTSKGDIVGFYGWMMQWVLPRTNRERESPSETLRKIVHSLADPADRILLLCSGGGRGLRSFPFEPHAGIQAVERVENVVAWLSESPPSVVAGGATLVAADARYVLDTQTEQTDLIIIESGRFQPMGWASPVGSQDTLITLESLARAREILSPDGLLLLNYHRVDSRRAVRYRQGLRIVDELGMPRTIVALDPRAALEEGPSRYTVDCRGPCWDVYIVAARTEAVLEGVREQLRVHPEIELEDDLALDVDVDVDLITDDQPFATWYGIDAPSRNRVKGIVLAGMASLVLALAALGWQRAPARGVIVPFAALGTGWMVVLTHALYSFRAAMVGPMQTTLWVTAAMLAWGTVGSLLAPRLDRALARRSTATWALLAVLGIHAVVLAHIPFSWPSDLARGAYLVAGLAPSGITLGALLPLALARLERPALAPALLADALGTGIGALVFYLVCLSYGFEVWFGVGVAAYVLAALTLPVRESPRSSLVDPAT